MRKLIFGCGYLGQRVAQRWRDAGAEVYVVTRSPQRAAEFANQNYQAIVADVTRPETLTQLPETDSVLFAVGFDRRAGGDIESVYAGGMRQVLAAMPAQHGPFIYISTTGVYGDAAGAWVDESTPTAPARPGGRASLAAEQILTAQRGPETTVLRLAGIYGPGRIPYLDKLRAGESIAAPSEGWLNLIHVDDAASIVVAADAWAANPNEGPQLWCVSDGHPVVRGEYYGEVARRIGAPPPKFAAPDPASPAAARAGSNKRISNHRLLDTLPVELAYPSYVEGLTAILGSE